MSNCCSNVKDSRVCCEGANYVKGQLDISPKKAIICCEGGCVKGEIARVAANKLAYRLKRDEAVRICLGDAATGNSGMIELVKRAPEIIAVEGCPLQCGTEILKLRIPDLQTSVVNASSLYSYDKDKYFEILDMPNSEVEKHADTVTSYILERFF